MHTILNYHANRFIKSNQIRRSDAFEIWLSFLDEGGNPLLRAWLVEEGLKHGLLVLEALVESSVEGDFDGSLCCDYGVLRFGGDRVDDFVDFRLETFSGK